VLKPNENGRILPETLREHLSANTAVVSIMWANNEIGALQEIDALAALAHESGALFHSDATQAIGKVPVDLHKSGIDAASFSSHKLCGPKGIGALYLKTGTPCEPLLYGGGQELGRRSGTQNVAGAVGFAAACKFSCESISEERARLASMRDILYERLCESGKAKPACPCSLGSNDYLPNIVSVLVPGYESETLILQLDIAGFAVSGGSACSTGSLDPSHVLSAIGISRDLALCSLRISLGRYTTMDDIERFLDAFERIVSQKR
jgi:cysteine desulfurase